jgi:hypothetical protein
MLYEAILSKLGSRMSLNFRPQEQAVYYSPLGRYYDGKMDLAVGVTVDGETRCLPFTKEHEHFAEVEQHLTMTSMLYRATWREKGLRLEAEFISPFYPQDEKLSTAPVMYARLAVLPFGQNPEARRSGPVEVVCRMCWDNRAAGVTRMEATAEAGRLHRKMMIDLSRTEIGTQAFFMPALKPLEMVLVCEDVLAAEAPAVAAESDGFRFTLTCGQDEAWVTWVCHTPDPILEIQGEKTPFKYTQFFRSADEVLAYATGQREEILRRTRFFDSLIAEASFTAAEKALHAFGFQSYLANSWWTVRPNGRDWYSVWEGCCLFHSTVDVEYNMAPFYLLFWPRLLELEIDAWADFALTRPDVAGKYISHDIGVRHQVSVQAYPHAMEIEENCNYLLMLHALWRVTGDDGPVWRNWGLVHELAAFLHDADKNGNGFPQVGVANTIDDASPAVQFSHEQTYLAVKTAAACRAVGLMAAQVGDSGAAEECEAQIGLIEETLQREAWLGDHYAVCIDQGLAEVADPWNEGQMLSAEVLEGGGRIIGWDAYSLYTSLGLLTLQMTGAPLPLGHEDRLRQDILRAAEESRGPYGCFHSSADHSNEWVSMNLHRDFVAAYLGLDLVTPHTGLYWNFELHNNSLWGRGGCFTDTYGGNFLHYYPRGLTSLGMLAALGGVRFDRVTGKLDVQPARLPLRLPLVQVADWQGMRVPWLRAECGEDGTKIEISDRDLLPG